MTHKVHPKAFRIRRMEDFNVRGFYGRNMQRYLQEDFLIKDYLRGTLSEALIANIEIEHTAKKLAIIIETSRQGVIIGRGGEGIEKLTKAINDILRKNKLDKEKREIKISVKEVKNPWTSAMLVGRMAAQQIEKRIPFRQVLKRNMERVMQNREIKGIKMEVAGRLNGTEIARSEWLKQGRMPLQSIRADIDYAQTEAHCSYGAIGIKVWIYKGDKFE